jgi:hypothetical protein
MAVNKTMINTFMTKQRGNALQVVDNQFAAQVNAEVENILNDKESKLYKALSAVAAAVSVYHNAYEDISGGLKVYHKDSSFRFCNTWITKDSYGSNEELMNILAQTYYENTNEYVVKSNARHKMRTEVNAQYDNVEQNVKRLKAPKAVEYLAELGFDVSSLNEEKTENFLAVPVEIKYLLINQGSSAV